MASVSCDLTLTVLSEARVPLTLTVRDTRETRGFCRVFLMVPEHAQHRTVVYLTVLEE